MSIKRTAMITLVLIAGACGTTPPATDSTDDIAFDALNKRRPASGLTATYFNHSDFTGSKITRVDPNIDFNWAAGSPDGKIQPDTFSARWTGQITAPVTGEYVLTTSADDGVRLWIDGKFAVDSWVDRTLTEDNVRVLLQEGRKYNIRLEYYEKADGAVVQFKWRLPGASTSVVVPTEQLSPTTGPDGVGAEIVQRPEGADLAVPAVVVTQAIQTDANDVPLVAGKPTYLRAFVTAGVDGMNPGIVRVEGRLNGTPLGTLDLPGPATAPLVRDDSRLAASCNIMLPGTWVQPGLELRVTADAANTVAETSEVNNAFPAAGWLKPDVRTVKPFATTFVPVYLQSTGVLHTAQESELNSRYLDYFRANVPVKDITARIRAPYTFSGDVNTTEGYKQLLSEITSLYQADRQSATYFPNYYGIINSGAYGGIAWLGYPVAIGRTGYVYTHELGHNFGVGHTPCGNPSYLVNDYPYPNADIGHWGLNVSTLTLQPPTTKDYLSYCSPRWTSDYTWKKIMNWRELNDRSVAPTATGISSQSNASFGDALLVTGHLQQGNVTFDPAFALRGVAIGASMPGASTTSAAGHTYTIEVLDAAGNVVGTATADILTAVAPHAHHEPESGHHLHSDAETHQMIFATVPLTREQAARAATVRARANGRVAGAHSANASDASAQALAVNARRNAQGRAQVTWDARVYRHALVRTPEGQVLGRSADGSITVFTDALSLEVVLSDGVRSVTRTVSVSN